MQRHSFQLRSSLCQQLSFLLLALALLSTFNCWPEIQSPLFYPIKYTSFAVTVLALAWKYWRLRHWHFEFSLDEYGCGLQPDEQRFQVGEKIWVSPWLVIFFMEQHGRQLPVLLFVDMFHGDDYRHLCRLLLHRRPQP
ncbi:hypothetical protein HR45_07500 [Shewanella mangrovi]|uniref:Toxin CptA n=1 Tax=Shewanella mangrovi TaxID=1515746 RepID=A0A094JGK0_9GAMM|nr:protein YgfX [Shewanella mangrovi]KFZ38322.1 hypothetical protein HR45_07500 [Shewanella mangrovi]